MARGADMAALQEELRRAAAALAYPPTPPLASAVRLRLEAEGRRRVGPADALGRAPKAGPGGRTSWVRGMAAALVMAALLAGLTFAAWPDARTALADFLGLRHVRVSVEPTPAATERPPVLSPESFAEPVTLAEARRLADFPLRFPTYPEGLGPPDAVYSQRFVEDTVIIFVYEKEGFDLHQSRLRGFFGKGAPEGTLEVEVAGAPALWIPEGGHVAEYLDAEGRPVPESRRTVQRATLLWESGEITYRLETSLSLAETVRVAESLADGPGE